MRISDWSSDVCSSDLGEAEYGVPAEQLGKSGRKECGEHCTRIAHAGEAHRLALMLGRIPAAGEGEGDREARAREAEDPAERECARETVDAEEPGRKQPGDDDALAARARARRPAAVTEQTDDYARNPGGDRRDRDTKRAGGGEGVNG